MSPCLSHLPCLHLPGPVGRLRDLLAGWPSPSTELTQALRCSRGQPVEATGPCSAFLLTTKHSDVDLGDQSLSAYVQVGCSARTSRLVQNINM